MSEARDVTWPEERVELRGLAKTDGPEETGFEAQVFIDGAFCGVAYDEGWGGEIELTDPAGKPRGYLQNKLAALAALARPSAPLYDGDDDLELDWDSFLGRCVDFAFLHQQLDDLLANHAVWVNKDNQVVPSAERTPPAVLERLKADPAYARRHVPSPSGLILNSMPLKDARRIFVRVLGFGDDPTTPDPYIELLGPGKELPSHHSPQDPTAGP